MPAARKTKASAASGSVFEAGVGAFVAAGSATTDGGVKRQRFVKDLISAGTWYKGDQAHEVPVERLNHWASTFSAMSKAGVKVPIPVGHTNDPEKNRGYVQDMFVQADPSGRPTLYMTAELIGEDAVKLAQRTEVSIFAEPSLTAGNGETFTDCITHAAIVTDPVIPKQQDWMPIAASRGGTVNVPVFRQESNMDWKPLATALSLDVTKLTDDNWFDACLNAVKSAKPDEALAASRAELKTATDALAAARAEIDTLKAGKAPAVDADALEMAAEAVEAKCDLQLSRIGKAAVDKLKALLVGKPDARPVLALSRTAAKAAGMPDTLARQVLDVIDAVVPTPKTGPQSGVQAFSRQVPGEAPTREDKDIDARAKGAYGKTA